MNKFRKKFLDTLNSINQQGINVVNSEELRQAIKSIAPNYYGIENKILANFDNLDFVTEREKGINASEENILIKKGIVFSRVYEFDFEFKNNIYTYDIVKNENNEFERTNFKIKDTSSKFKKLNMFNFFRANEFFKINEMLRDEKYHNQIYEILNEINKIGYNSEISERFNDLFKYVSCNDVEELLYSLGKIQINSDYTKNHFRVTQVNGVYNLIPCEEGIDNDYEDDIYVKTEFEENKFLDIDDRIETLKYISSFLSNNLYYEYSIKQI